MVGFPSTILDPVGLKFVMFQSAWVEMNELLH